MFDAVFEPIQSREEVLSAGPPAALGRRSSGERHSLPRPRRVGQNLPAVAADTAWHAAAHRAGRGRSAHPT